MAGRRLLELLTAGELRSVRAQCPTAAGTKVTVGMSGGVDSSVSAALLVGLGHLDVRGCFMKNWDMAEEEPTLVAACSQEQDLKDAQFVAQQLGLPEVAEVDFTKEYWCKVWEPCLKQYERGKTPNPDTLCNRQIKFDLFQRAYPGAVVATGHYARLNSDHQLCRGLDPNKDQSYFLSTVLPHQFQRACFPIGGLDKRRVKFLAREIGLDRIANRPESQGVCFIGERGKRFSSFLEDYLLNPGGEFRSVLHPEKRLGRHQGLLSYTVGQRARVSGLDVAHFVAKKDSRTGDVWIAPLGHPAHRVDWVGVRFERELFDSFAQQLPHTSLEAQVRYRTQPVACTVEKESEGEDGFVTCRVRFHDAVSVPEGQVLALYAGDRCLGGGEITAAHHAYFD